MWSSRGWVLALALLAFTSASLAAPPPPAHPLSDYEEESIEEALDEVSGVVDPAPAGKRIEGIDVVSFEVVEHRDPAPELLNLVHTTTRRDVILREMLLRPGDVYDAALVEETERNLKVRQLSVVLIVPIAAKDPAKVRLLVVAKDVWSLRVNWDVVFVNGRVQALVLQPSEENLAGRHKTVLTNVVLGRATYMLGAGFVDPRVGGSRLLAAATANVVFNCRTGSAEGSNGVFQYGKPLYSTRTKWSWVTAASWAQGIVRPAGTLGQSLCTGDTAVSRSFPVASTGQTFDVPYQYRQDVLRSEISATRSFGIETKNNVSFGLEATRREFSPFRMPAVPLVVQAAFERRLPVSDTRLSPFVQLHAFGSRFLRVLDFETLGLQEDYRLGHDVWLKGFPASKAAGSSRTFLGVFSGAGYTVALGDGLARALVGSTIELGAREETDATVEAAARVVSPRLPFGRIVVDGSMLDRYRNYLNPSVALGGTGRLRGYRTSAFVGPDFVTANVEVRSRPLEILSVQVGATAFYDVGDAFCVGPSAPCRPRFSDLRLKQGAGAGLRFAFPQIQRAVFRVDLGFPLTRDAKEGETTLVAQFEQAFGVPALAAPGLVQ